MYIFISECHAGCLTCDSTSATGCLSCVEGKYLDGDGSCQREFNLAHTASCDVNSIIII